MRKPSATSHLFVVNADVSRLLRVFLAELVGERAQHDAALDEVVEVHRLRAAFVEHAHAQLAEVVRPESCSIATQEQRKVSGSDRVLTMCIRSFGMRCEARTR